MGFVAQAIALLLLTAQPEPAKADPVPRLIEQLGSKSFEEREAAVKRLEALGDAALPALREAVKSATDPEVRRRAQHLVRRLEPDPLDKLFQEGVRLETVVKDYKKAAEVFEELAQLGKQRYHPNSQTSPPNNVPFLTEVFVHLARVACKLENYDRATQAYRQATYYANPIRDKRQEVEREWSEMVETLLAGWREGVLKKVGADPGLNALLAKYPLVVLHSHRYAGGENLQSMYSFLYETFGRLTHRSDCQLQFGNGGRGNTFIIQITRAQQNRLADLGVVDFRQDPDPQKADFLTSGIKAVEGHVYLEKVADDRGNNFHVLFQVVATDADSRFVAIVWRMLPGGTVVKR